jgi:hypothetical protein
VFTRLVLVEDTSKDVGFLLSVESKVAKTDQRTSEFLKPYNADSPNPSDVSELHRVLLSPHPLQFGGLLPDERRALLPVHLLSDKPEQPLLPSQLALLLGGQVSVDDSIRIRSLVVHRAGSRTVGRGLSRSLALLDVLGDLGEKLGFSSFESVAFVISIVVDFLDILGVAGQPDLGCVAFRRRSGDVAGDRSEGTAGHQVFGKVHELDGTGSGESLMGGRSEPFLSNLHEVAVFSVDEEACVGCNVRRPTVESAGARTLNSRPEAGSTHR